ncbi:MAG: hypothetical protein HPY71_01840 [Firmicutes bacterium]|nr:hypothetical protein [Bacillota bacterium]
MDSKQKLGILQAEMEEVKRVIKRVEDAAYSTGNLDEVVGATGDYGVILDALREKENSIRWSIEVVHREIREATEGEEDLLSQLVR